MDTVPALEYLKLLRLKPPLYVQGGLSGLASASCDKEAQALLQAQVRDKPSELLPLLTARVENSNLRVALLSEFSCCRGARCLGYSPLLGPRPERSPAGPLLMQLSEPELWVYDEYERYQLGATRSAGGPGFLDSLQHKYGQHSDQFKKMASLSFALLQSHAQPRPCVLCYRDIACKWVQLCAQRRVVVEKGVLLQRALTEQPPRVPGGYCAWALQALPADVWTGFCQPPVRPCLAHLRWRSRQSAGLSQLFIDQSQLLHASTPGWGGPSLTPPHS